jgi:Arc/MetJ-type ribon-helix-helix transcriptional regulator
MRAERVTITLPADDAARLRAVVAAGLAPSVSAYVADAVHGRLARDTALAALRDLWGDLDPAALAWARERLAARRAGRPAA